MKRLVIFAAAASAALLAVAGMAQEGAEVERMVRQLTPVSLGGAAQTPQEASVSLPVEFDFASAQITPSSAAILHNIAAALNDPRLIGGTFIVEGHTDAVGTWEANLLLSQRRAEAVASYLAALGVARGRLTPVGYGEGRLLSGLSETDRRNRRVVVVRELSP